MARKWARVTMGLASFAGTLATKGDMDKRRPIDHVGMTSESTPMRSFSTITGIALIGTLLALSACTRVVTIRVPLEGPAPGAAAPIEPDDAWWSIAFRMDWDREQSPEWYLDALLADQVCAPALTEFRSQIRLWRFHRRAGQDKVGHRFKLLVFTDAETAEALYRRVRADSVLQWLESERLVVSVTMTGADETELPRIARSSDGAWPPEIQASWPWFIMGVSQTWLSLIQQVTMDEPAEELSTQAVLDYYDSVNDRVDTLWRKYGQHVYLHHLNALFGYQPLIIRETNLKRF